MYKTLITKFLFLIFVIGSNCFSNLLYNRPELYVGLSKQTMLDDNFYTYLKKELKDFLRWDKTGNKHVFLIQNWAKNNFVYLNDNGRSIGKRTAQDIYRLRFVRNEHDIALIYLTALRLLGYSAILVETTSISWTEDYAKGMTQATPFGHVFVEVFLDNKWILIDPQSGQYLSDYDPNNPLIDLLEDEKGNGFFVIGKGLDDWDLGILSKEELIAKQIDTALSWFSKSRL